MVENGHFGNLNFQGFFFQYWKTQLSKTFLIYILAFDPVKICTLYASQKDSQKLSFVKDIIVVGDKMTRNGDKMTISKSCIFRLFFLKREAFSNHIEICTFETGKSQGLPLSWNLS